MPRHIETEERIGDGRIEIWRNDAGQWFASWAPDMKTSSDYAGRTYSSEEAGVANDSEALLAWAKQQFGASQ